MNLQLDNVLFKKIVIVFWTLWWLIALYTDIVGILAHHNVLNASWALDKNYPLLVKSLSMYHVPTWFSACLFAGILFSLFIIAGLFCWASLGLAREYAIWFQRARTAFIVSLTFWFAFYLADQLVMDFALEQNHMVQGGLELLTFLALYIL